jgi:catechol 2,3-dioxygenase-like lactoylglutathione lyase family enzyme
MTSKLADVRLLVDRFDECVAFYQDVMGLKLKMRIPEGTYAEFETESAVLSLYERRLMEDVVGTEHRQNDPHTDRVALIFRVDDVDAEVEALKGRGATFDTEPHDQAAWGLRVAHLRDPDGTLIELYHPLPAEA